MPDLTRHPERLKDWIPASAGMTIFAKAIVARLADRIYHIFKAKRSRKITAPVTPSSVLKEDVMCNAALQG